MYQATRQLLSRSKLQAIYVMHTDGARLEQTGDAMTLYYQHYILGRVAHAVIDLTAINASDCAICNLSCSRDQLATVSSTLFATKII